MWKYLCILFFIPHLSFSQKNSPHLLFIKKATGKIILDGELNESDWKNAEVAKYFFQNFPADSLYAKTKTKSSVTYDDNFFYVSAICYDSIPGDYVVQSLKRDFSYPVNDAFAVYLDPFNDHTNGFNFTVSPLGVQREGLLAFGGGFGVSTDWDTKWFSEVKHFDNYWTVEMAIPFKALRYSGKISTWGINFSRNDLKRNENSSWSPVPRGYNIGSLAFTGELNWDSPPKKTGGNVVLIPYLIGSVNEDFVNDSLPRYKPNAGLDAKIAISSSLNLDVTVNPDFSQVEVDRQVTNLTRFSLFFPEKRNFFIENSDLFDRFGFRQIKPFFSRRIGLNDGEVIPIIAGARLSGKLNKNWRIGMMNIQTEKKGALNLESQNYTVGALQRTIFGRSNISAIFVNRQILKNEKFVYTNFNRIVGADFNLATNDNKFFGKVFYHHSFNPNNPKNSYAHASFLKYETDKIGLEWNHEYVGENYSADAGFVPKQNQYNPNTGLPEKRTYWRLEDHFNYNFYPKSNLINRHGAQINYNHYLDKDFNTTDYTISYLYNFSFVSSDFLEFGVYQNYVKLIYPTNIGSIIPAGNYDFWNFILHYTSTSRKKVFGNASVDYGKFYNGTKLSYSAELTYRAQPWGVFALSFTEDELRFPDTIPNAYLTLIGPKIEFSFTKSLFFTTFVQYNTQENNVNLNARFQWRFKPMSDLYIVYTDNYDSYNFEKKNRALVVKLIYWLRI